MALSVLGWLVAATAYGQSADRLSRAEAAFSQGRIAFEQGDMVGAREGFAEAYALTEDLAIRYNLGVVEERVGHYQEAIEHFRAYLDAPSLEDEAAVRARIEDLEERLAERSLPGASRTADLPSTNASSSGGEASPGPWIAVGIGGAVAVVGAIFLGLSVAASDTVSEAHGVDWSEVSGSYDEAVGFSVAGAVLLSVGVAAVAAGLLWLLLRDEGGQADVVFGPGGLRLGGAF